MKHATWRRIGCAMAFLVASSTMVSAQGQLSDMELLGKHLFFDKTLSNPARQACADCHVPKAGWTSPEPGINLNRGPHPGAVQQRSGARKPPTVSYATFAPKFHFTGQRYEGGNFWDGRATGDILGTPAADQARDPFFSPVEMNLASEQELCEKVSAAHYAGLFETVWGAGSLANCENPEQATGARNNIAASIAAYEDSPEVSQFSAKFDAALTGEATLSAQEMEGRDLVQANCGCHSAAKGLFTNFAFFNLGVPKNPKNPVYNEDPGFIDRGLGGFLETLGDGRASENMGKFKVPTLRNVDTRPGKGFTKAYMHNGVFKSLKEVVHFYNTRDAMIADGSLVPEVSEGMVTSIGNLGLTDAQEDAIVAFLRTLSDQDKISQPQTAARGKK